MIADLDLSPEQQESILAISKDLTGEERDIMFQSLKDIDAEEDSSEEAETDGTL